MPKKFILLIGCFWLFVASNSAQCPDEKDLRNRIGYLNMKVEIPPKVQLAELLPYLAAINDCPYKDDSTHVFLLRKIAIEYFYMEDFATAVNYERKALGVMRVNEGKRSVNPKDLITMYYYLSLFYDSLNNARESRAAIDSCINIGMRLKCFSEYAFIFALARVAQLHYDVGDYRRCIDDATECEKLAAEYISSTNPADRRFGLDLSSHGLGWHVKALLELNEYEAAENLLADKLVQYKKTGSLGYLGLICSQMADLEIHKGNYQNALLFLKRSVTYSQQTGNYFNCKQTLKDIGYNIYYEHLHDGAGAMVYYRKALAYSGLDKSELGNDAMESLDIWADIANIYIRKEAYDSAFFYFRKAFDQIKPGANETTILHLPPEKLIEIKKIHYLTNLIVAKGDACLKKYLKTKDHHDLSQSIHIYKVTDSLFDRIKVEQIEMESKLFWRKNSRRMYEHAISACYLSGNTTDAFYFFEKSRAVILNDQLSEQHWQSDKDIMELSQARKNVLMLEREIQIKDNSAGPAAVLHKELLDKRYQLDQLEQTVKAKNPLYYQSFLDRDRISPGDIDKKILNDHQALLELFEGDSAVYSLLLTPGHIYLNKIDKPDFDNSARLYISLLSSADLLNRKQVDFSYAAHHLYEMIFEDHTLPQGRIIISPDGAYFPFESLVTDNTLPGSPVYFIKDHAVSYTYSARYLLNEFTNGENKAKGTVLGVAPVRYPYFTSLVSLAGSDISLDHVGSYFKEAHTLVGEKASKHNFLEQFSKYSVIQLYTHASDTSDRNEPIIYFSDSGLYLSELIQENKPSTQLIVISACNTGNGKFNQGEGIFSFNRAFAAIGIPGSVVNLWSVDSKSTYRITELFYRYLSKGMTTDRALQSAKLEFIRGSDRGESSPYYWAAAILVGKTDTIILENAFPWKTLAALSVIAGLFFFQISYRRNKWGKHASV